MPCGCSENNKLNDNKKLDNNKILSLDSMASMSIDEIINLYKSGYILEDLGNNVNIVPLGYNDTNRSIIENLSYGTECSGSPTIDRSWTSTNPADFMPIAIKYAYAQKFTPTSRCLSSVSLRVRKVLDVDATVTICSDSGGKPVFPAGNLGEFTRNYSDLSFSFTEVTFPLNILLSNLNPLWIVITSMYDPNYLTPDIFIDVDAFWDTNGNGNNLCFKSGNNAWIYKLYARPFFKTFKLNYSVLDTITISPLTASLNTGATQPLTATCKDAGNNIITCPTLIWYTSNQSVATVNSGLVTAISVGTANISCTGGGKNSTSPSVITVISPLNTITISPTPISLNINNTQQLTAVCKDLGNNIITCPTLIWASDNPTVATVNSTGLVTALVTAISAGTANISCSGEGKTSNSSVITVATPANITMQNITVGGIPCMSGCNITCTTNCPAIVNIVVTWANSGGSSGTFTPKVTVGAIITYGNPITVAPGETTKITTFSGVSLPQGTPSICVDTGTIT